MKVSIPRVRNYLLPLPAHVKLAVNQKLRDGWRHRAVSDWLFAQIADRDIPEHLLKAGDPYALIWIRNARDPIVAQENCRTTVSHWFEGSYYTDWLAKQPDITTDFRSRKVVDFALKVIWKKSSSTPKPSRCLTNSATSWTIHDRGIRHYPTRQNALDFHPFSGAQCASR